MCDETINGQPRQWQNAEERREVHQQGVLRECCQLFDAQDVFPRTRQFFFFFIIIRVRSREFPQTKHEFVLSKNVLCYHAVFKQREK